MNEFKTILDKKVSAEIVEKKSRFIANLFYTETSKDAEKIIKDIKKKYYDAKHNCFAYLILENNQVIKKFSDDGEPSGTAGASMLEILEKMGIYNIVIIVTRYFGGILLGTGGLVRAYSDSLKKALSSANIVKKELGYEVNVNLEYSNLEKFKYYCNKNNINIINCTYSNIVVCKIEINEEEKSNLEYEIKNKNNLNILRFDIIRQKYILQLSNIVD